MKVKNMRKIIANIIRNVSLVIFMAVFLLYGCSNLNTGEDDREMGTITINLGGRASLARATGGMGQVTLYISFYSDKAENIENSGPYYFGQNAIISVPPADDWTIVVRAALNGVPYATGSSVGFVEVIAGAETPVTIQMEVDLYDYIAGAMDLGDNPIPLPLAFVLDNSKWADILNELQILDTFRVDLDLSLCGRSDEISGSGLSSEGVFDPRGGNFIGKGNIISLILPNEAEIIPDGTSSQATFRDFSSLVSLITGDELTYIGDNAFSNLNLTSVILGKNLETIGEDAFLYNDLVEIAIPASVKSIGDYAFYGNSLNIVSFLGDTVETIGSYAFYGNNLEEIAIPSGVTIGESAFSNNDLMTRVEIGANCIIERSAFSNNDLMTRVEIGTNCIIEIFAFINCPLLESITIGADIEFESETNPGNDSFDNGFDDFYIGGGREAGIYTWDGTQLQWNHEPLP